MPPTPSPDPILIKMVEGESSFWDSTFWTGALPIIGVLLGAVVAYLFALLQEKQKARHALATHFIDQVVEHSTKLSRATEGFIRRGNDLNRILELEPRVQQRQSTQMSIAEIRTTMHEAFDDIEDARSHLAVIAPAPLRNGSSSISIPSALVIVKDDLDAKFLESSLEHINKNLTKFKEDVRKFVGVAEPKDERPSRSTDKR